MTANQSRLLTTPRVSVGRAKAARMALGTASNAYSGSKGLRIIGLSSKLHSSSMNGNQIWGARIMWRQRQMPSSTKGHVGHKNQGRARPKPRMYFNDTPINYWLLCCGNYWIQVCVVELSMYYQ